MAQNAASIYQGTKINTASPAELTLMLYEGAIKFCNKALYGLEQNDFTKVNENLVKAQKIVTELRSTLDFKYPISREFDTVYDYINRRLVDANIKKDTEILEEALEYIRQMRDTWKEVMKKNNIYVQ
ncbi:MAG TPA: flagellar export chaperone FliS [Lachnoclostridium phytofermentans]|uniref:Flagellar secretion chaperone FliS n=1 Tax=Lachnoclostridium phytofermentans TaxID=66219 RepID=A0A3D2X2G8_9FIRM|nr:flagellar export chaperone FliS [Lachnoclostridium sp.]HCL01166.1 flagellar export chaperone FliS [Lachnoclostridium phytofermentans]